MPDTPPESGADETGTAGAQQPDEVTKSLDDVPEWVSEIRRLYVEPKTRARLRQEGAIAPQKRKLGLPGMRGPRRSGDGNTGDRAGGAHSARAHGDPAEPSDVSGQAPTAPSAPIFTSTAAVPPAAVPPADPDPVYDVRGVAETDVSGVEPQPIVEEQVGAWLNSYLVATGHAADDGDAEGPAEDGSSDARDVDEAPRASSQIPQPSATAAADPEDRGDAPEPQPWSGADAGARAGSDLEPLEEERHRSLAELAGLSPPEPSPDTWLPAVPPAPAAEPPVDTVVTSIPESAGESEPRPVSAPVAQPEPLIEPSVVEPAITEPAATEPAAEYDAPDPAPVAEPTTPAQPVVEAVVPEPAPDMRQEPELADGPGARTVEASEAQPARSTAASQVVPSLAAVAEPPPVAAVEDTTPAPAVEETSTPMAAVEETTPVVATPDTSPAPAAEETTPVAVVEGSSPDPSQEAPVATPADRAAEDGSDHTHRSSPGRPSTVPAVTLSWREAESFDIGLPDVEDDEGAIVVEPPSQLVAARRRRREHDDSDAPPPPTESEVEPEEQPEPDPTPSEATGRSSTLRWILIAVIGLLIVAAAAWYFLLRDDGSGSGAPSGAGTVVTASTHAPGADPMTPFV